MYIQCVHSVCLLLDYLFKVDGYTSNNTLLTARTLCFRVILQIAVAPQANSVFCLFGVLFYKIHLFFFFFQGKGQRELG